MLTELPLKLLTEHIFEYDEYGNIILDATSFATYTYNYEYNYDGNIIAMQEYITEGGDTYLYQEYRHEYNANRKEIRYTFTDNSIPDINNYHSRYTLYEYNDVGELIKEIIYSSNDDIIEWTDYEYTYN